MRQNKPFTFISYQKYEVPELHLHCAIHRAWRMIRLVDGLRCQICGGTEIATKTAMTIEAKKKLRKKLHYINGLH